MTLLSDEEQVRLIEAEIEVYESMQKELEANHRDEWVVICGGEFIGAYTDFQDAAAVARRTLWGWAVLNPPGRGWPICPASVFAVKAGLCLRLKFGWAVL